MTEQRRVFLLCFRLLRDQDEADLASQDTFFKAHRALGKGGVEIEDSGKWLTRIAVNTCLDRIRSRTWKFWRRRPGPEDERRVLENAWSRAPSAEDEVFASQIRRRITIGLERLSARQRAVFVLRHYEQRSVEDIGGILGLDTGTVKAHMSRALAKMRDELRDLYGLRGSNELLERSRDSGTPLRDRAGGPPPGDLRGVRRAVVPRPRPDAAGG